MKLHFFITVNLSALLITAQPSPAQQKATIYSINNDTAINQLIELKAFPFRWSDFAEEKKIFHERNTEKKMVVDFALNRSEMKTVQASLDWQHIYVSPGDSIGFNVICDDDKRTEFVEYHLEFAGENAGNYNFMYEFKKRFPLPLWPYYKKGGNIAAYRDSLIVLKEKQLNFLKTYGEQHSMSEGFISYVNAYIDDKFAFYIYTPVCTKQIAAGDLPENYFDGVYRLPLKDESLTNVYGSSLIYRFVDFHLNADWSDLDFIYNNILHKTEGKTKEYLISALIGIFADHQGQNYETELLNIIKQSPKYVSDTVYTEYIRLADSYYRIHNKPFPEDILTDIVLKNYKDESGRRSTLKTILEQFQGKPVYIDFWASWCSPCRLDIQESAEAKAFLKEKDVAYVYISVDEKEENWRKAVTEEDIAENQYLIAAGALKSPLVKYLQFISIPRYILLDKEHKVKLSNAPRPNEYGLPALKQEIEKLNRTVFRFD
ncbi:MAG: TlpA family protein disulfide reductase [Tannerella sp.]|jgi:thiol-disulfide isomerase/thioredoxin|nr:TlpA family protein disulfide reductase [Tannerella sp.]